MFWLVFLVERRGAVPFNFQISAAHVGTIGIGERNCSPSPKNLAAINSRLGTTEMMQWKRVAPMKTVRNVKASLN